MEEIVGTTELSDGKLQGILGPDSNSPGVAKGSTSQSASISVRKISFEEAMQQLGGSYAGNVPACS